MNSDIVKRFEETYQSEADMVFRFCIVKVSDRETARDLTQEAFTRLFQTMQSGVVIEYPKAWLMRITRNLIIDWYRKKKPVSLETMLEDEGEAKEPADERSYRAIELSAEAQLILRVFGELDDDFREVLHLRYVEDLEPREIAEVLNITANLVSVRLTRGMAALREMLGESDTK